MIAEITDYLVHRGLEGHHAADGVVLDNRALQPGVFGLVGGAEHVVHDLPIDQGAVVVVELGLFLPRVSIPIVGFWKTCCGHTKIIPSAIFHRCCIRS